MFGSEKRAAKKRLQQALYDIESSIRSYDWMRKAIKEPTATPEMIKQLEFELNLQKSELRYFIGCAKHELSQI